MKLLGAALIAGAGLWLGLLVSRDASREVARCAGYVRMLERMALELERFKTPLPDLFASLAEGLDGPAAVLCRRTAEGLDAGKTFGEAWEGEISGLPERERSILLSLGGVLGRYGGEEQSACVEAARLRMAALRDERQSGLGDRRRIAVGLCAAAGALLAVLLI